MKHTQFTNPEAGISGAAPDGWAQAETGVWLRRSSKSDPTHLVQQRVGGLSCEEILAVAAEQEGLEALPQNAGMIESTRYTWDWYRGEVSVPAPMVVDLALAQQENWIYVVALGAAPDEIDELHEAVFLPAIRSLAPAAPDMAYTRQVAEHAETYQQMIRANRAALRNGPWPDFPTQSDQKRGIPIPAPQQPYDDSAELINLPQPDPSIITKPDLFTCIADRKSHRQYAEKRLSLQELAYLLWATQGMRQVIMGGKGSLRTVPASGARHPFETYLAVNRVEGIEPGMYRYLPFEHKLVSLFADDDLAEKLGNLAMGQSFVDQAAVCFIWSAVPYREEWRYGTQAAKGILLDAGHVCQNLYLACESIGCGTCAIAAYEQDELDHYLGLDGEEELVVYLAPVGKINDS